MLSLSQAFGRPVPFAEFLGMRLTCMERGLAVLEMELRPEFMNTWQVAHGGVVMTLADVALAVAARTLDDAAEGAITVELKVSFISPGEGRLIAEGRSLHAGKSLAFCEGEVKDQAGKLVAKALGTFMLRHGRPAPGDSI